MLSLISEIKTLRLISATFSKMIGPISLTLGVVLLIMYFYAIWGMYLFGGLIRTDTDGLPGLGGNYHLINFNDMLSSYLTLWIFIINGNWWVISEMFVGVSEN